ncbi:MAG: universal stress protein [Roseibacillus sp.]
MSTSDIIVGIDFSEASQAALKEAGYIANLRKSELHLVHVIDIEFFENAIDEKYLTFDSLKAQAEKSLQKLALESFDFPPPFHFHIFIGHPFEELENATKSLHCDLLVLGCYGNSGNKDRTGTIATRFVRKSALPVLLVREKERVPFKTIVACHDFSPTSDKALAYATEVALAHQSHLHILHVQLTEPYPYNWTYDMPSLPDTFFVERQERLQKKVAAAANGLLQDHPNLQITTAVRDGGSSDKEIIDYVTQMNADLTILGTRGRTGIKSILLGTTAEKIVHKCPSSVLTVKPDPTK